MPVFHDLNDLFSWRWIEKGNKTTDNTDWQRMLTHVKYSLERRINNILIKFAQRGKEVTLSASTAPDMFAEEGQQQ